MPAPPETTFSKEEIEELVKAKVDWPTKSRLEKDELKKALITKILQGRQHNVDDFYARGFLKVRLTTWFSNNTPATETRLPKSVKTSWSGRDVFNEVEAEKIDERVEAMLADNPGMVYIAALNKTRKEMWKGLPEEEQDTYEEQADQWTQEGPSEEYRIQIASRRMPNWVRSTAALYWKQGGVFSLQILYWLDENGQLNFSRFDTSELFGKEIPKFADKCPEWKKNTVDELGKFAEEWLRPPAEGDEAGPQEKQAGPPEKAPVVLEFYEDGFPILPLDDPTLEVKHRLARRKEVLRVYLNANYALACGIPGRAVPWGTVVENRDRFFEPGMLPRDVSIKQPKHMVGADIHALWQHIHDIQNKRDESRFRFACVGEGKKLTPATYQPVATEHDGTASGSKKGRKAGARLRAPPGFRRLAPANTADEADTHGGPARKTRRGRGRSTARANDRKGKGRAADGSESSARSSGAPSSAEEIDLHLTSGSGSTVDDEDPDPKVKAGPSSRAHRSAVVDQPLRTQPQPRPRRRVDAEGPLVPPANALIEAAKYQPPSWTKDDAHVIAFLWSLSGEREYRDLITSWIHTLVLRLELGSVAPAPWITWTSQQTWMPQTLHLKREAWDQLLTWICEARPNESSSGESVQAWLMVTGMALRDISIVNDINPEEPEEPIPHHAPEYFRQSTAQFSDIRDVILPACQEAHHPLTADTTRGRQALANQPGPSALAAPPQAGPSPASPPPAIRPSAAQDNAATPSTKRNVVKAKRGGPPGIRVSDIPFQRINAPAEHEQDNMDVDMGDDGPVHSAGSISRARERVPYVLITTRPPLRALSASASGVQNAEARPLPRGQEGGEEPMNNNKGAAEERTWGKQPQGPDNEGSQAGDDNNGSQPGVEDNVSQDGDQNDGSQAGDQDNAPHGGDENDGSQAGHQEEGLQVTALNSEPGGEDDHEQGGAAVDAIRRTRGGAAGRGRGGAAVATFGGAAGPSGGQAGTSAGSTMARRAEPVLPPPPRRSTRPKRTLGRARGG